MQRFLATGRILRGVAAALLATQTAASATSLADPASDTVLRKAARPGAYCSFTSCRPRAASPLTGAAFGAAVVAIGWRARRRGADEA